MNSTGTNSSKITDLAELDTVKGAEEGYELELRHPTTGEPIGAFITVIGEDSDRYQEHLRALQKKSVDQFVRSRKVNGVDPEEEGINLLAAATKSWHSLPPVDGKALEFSTGNARTLYKRFPWIREQVAVAVRERANFLPRSAAD